jgi:hypothetical protein
LLSVLVLALISNSAQAACCRVEGIVRSQAGIGVADATVALSAPDLKAPMMTTTTADGRYQFDGVKPGIWAQVRVLVNGRAVAEGVTLVTQPVETLNIAISAASTSATSLEDLKPGGGESGELRGVVRATDGTPLPGARVGIDAVGIQTTTDSAGRYSFGRVRAPLTIDMSASANGFTSATKQVSVTARGSADMDFSLTPQSTADEEPLGLAETPRDRESLTLRTSELTELPGFGPFDVFRAIELLPIASLFDSSELVLNGLAPGTTHVTIDDIPWFPSARLAGQIGAPLNTAFIQEAGLADAPLGASSGGSLGGVLGFNGRRTRQDHPAGTAEVDFFGVGGSASIPLAHMGSVSFGARHSLSSQLYGDVLDAFAGPDQHYVRDRVPSLPGATPLAATPSFSDYNGRLELDPGRGNRISASLYHGNDDGNFSRDIAAGPSTDIAVPPVLPLPSDTTMQIGDTQTWKGQGGSIDWSRQWTHAISTDASFAQSKFTTARQRSFLLTSPTTNLDYNLVAGLGGSSGTNEANEVRDTDLRADVSIEPGFGHAFDAGFQYTTLDVTYAAKTEALVQNPVTGVAASQLTTLMNRQDTGHVSTVFAQDTWTPLATLTISPGARLVNYDLAATTYVDPRVSASYVPGPGFVLKGAWSIDHQPAPRITREDRQHGDMDFWTLADGSSIPIPRSREASGEATYERTGVLVDAKLYYRWLDSLSLFAPRLLPGEAPATPTSGLYVGTGTSTGLQFLVQQNKERNSIWVSYTISRAEYSFPGLESSTFLASFDRRQQLKAADSFRVWRGLSATAVMMAGTGAPYTQASTAEPVWFPNGAVAYQPRFGAKNANQLPAYHHLDVSGQYDLHIGPATASAGVTVFNVYDRKNIAYYDYEVAGSTLVTTETYLMRRAVNAFFRVRF